MPKEMTVSRFKATCLAVMDDVRKTGIPVRVTKFGKPLADVVAIRTPPPRDWLGCMAGSVEFFGDIKGSAGAFDNWDVENE